MKMYKDIAVIGAGIVFWTMYGIMCLGMTVMLIEALVTAVKVFVSNAGIMAGVLSSGYVLGYGSCFAMLMAIAASAILPQKKQTRKKKRKTWKFPCLFLCE